MHYGLRRHLRASLAFGHIPRTRFACRVNLGNRSHAILPGFLYQRNERRVLRGEDSSYLDMAHPLARTFYQTCGIRYLGAKEKSEVDIPSLRRHLENAVESRGSWTISQRPRIEDLGRVRQRTAYHPADLGENGSNGIRSVGKEVINGLVYCQRLQSLVYRVLGTLNSTHIQSCPVSPVSLIWNMLLSSFNSTPPAAPPSTQAIEAHSRGGAIGWRLAIDRVVLRPKRCGRTCWRFPGDEILCKLRPTMIGIITKWPIVGEGLLHGRQACRRSTR